MKPETTSLLVSLSHEVALLWLCSDPVTSSSHTEQYGKEAAAALGGEEVDLSVPQFTTALRFVLKKPETQAQAFASGLFLIIVGGMFLFFLNNFISNSNNLIFQLF